MHEVTSMMYVGELPWHQLGALMPEAMTCVQVQQDSRSGQNFDVGLERIYTADGMGGATMADQWRAVVRQGPMPTAADLMRQHGLGSEQELLDRGVQLPRRVLGMVSPSYGCIQTSTMAQLADTIAGKGNACCHTAGVLQGGAWCWFLLKLPGEIRVPGDPSPTEKYLMVSGKHDGSGSLRVLFTAVRVVCANTATAAIRGAQNWFKIRHTAGADERIKNATDTMVAAATFFERYEQLAQALADARYTDGQLDDLAEHLYPNTVRPKGSGKAAAEADASVAELNAAITEAAMREAGAKLSREIDAEQEARLLPSAATLAKREVLRDRWEQGTGIEGDMKGTAWAALQAVTEASDHGREWRPTKRATAREQRFTSLMDGDTQRLQTKAVDYITQQVGLN